MSNGKSSDARADACRIARSCALTATPIATAMPINNTVIRALHRMARKSAHTIGSGFMTPPEADLRPHDGHDPCAIKWQDHAMR